MLLSFKWARLGAKLIKNGKQSVVREFDVFGLRLGGDFGQLPRDVYEFAKKWLGIPTENVATVTIRVSPRTIQ